MGAAQLFKEAYAAVGKRKTVIRKGYVGHVRTESIQKPRKKDAQASFFLG